MFVSKKEKILFFHVPKTAGTSVTNFLYENCSDGKFYYNLNSELFLKEYTSVYHTNIENIHPVKLARKEKSNNLIRFMHLSQSEGSCILKKLDLNLDDFVEIVVVRNPYERIISYYNFILYRKYNNINQLLDAIELNQVDPTLHWRNQLDYIKNPITRNLKIFKYENLNHCEEFLQTILNTTEKLPKLNVTKKQLVNDLDLDTKQRIYEMFQEEFELLEYEK